MKHLIIVRIEQLKWCRTLAPVGYPNRSTMCATFCTTKKSGPFDKGFVTPEFMVDLPAMSRGITYRFEVEVLDDNIELVRVVDVVFTPGPDFAQLKTQICDWIRHSPTRLKVTVVSKAWFPEIFNDIGMTADEFKAMSLTERRAIWASHDWSGYHKAVQMAVDGLWLSKDTLRSLMGVCVHQRTSVLPLYWEQRGLDTRPEIDRTSPATLVVHDVWSPCGWSVCLPFTKISAFSYWHKWAAVLNNNIYDKQRANFDMLVENGHMVTVGQVSFWSQWRAQWEAVFDLWLLAQSGSTMSERNCRTVISLVGTCDAFLYEWKNSKKNTTVFTTSVERAEMLQSFGYHIVVFSLKGVFFEYGEQVQVQAPEPSDTGRIRINISSAQYVLFDNAQDWTLAHGYRALQHIASWNKPDVRIGLLYIKPESDMVRWDNDASPRIFASLLASATGDLTYHVCENGDQRGVGVPERIEAWKKVQGVYAADDTGVLQNRMDDFVGIAQRPIYVCETQKLVQHVNNILFGTSSRTRFFVGERVYLHSLDMYGEIVSFVSHDRMRSKKLEGASAGMFRDTPPDMCVDIGGVRQVFEMDKLSVAKATVVTPGMLRGHSGWVLFVLGSEGWMTLGSFKRYLCLFNPRLARLVAPRKRLKALLKTS